MEMGREMTCDISWQKATKNAKNAPIIPESPLGPFALGFQNFINLGFLGHGLEELLKLS